MLTHVSKQSRKAVHVPRCRLPDATERSLRGAWDPIPLSDVGSRHRRQFGWSVTSAYVSISLAHRESCLYRPYKRHCNVTPPSAWYIWGKSQQVALLVLAHVHHPSNPGDIAACVGAGRKVEHRRRVTRARDGEPESY